MALIKQDAVVTDDWVSVDDEADLPAAEAILVSLSRWRRQRDTLMRRNGRLGLRLAVGEVLEEITDDLDRFALVAVEFPSFKDGRGYSTARLLRDRHDYRGELRAVGNILPDQALFLERCGFDSYEVDQQVKAAIWSQSRRAISGRYQTSSDRAPTIPDLRQISRRGAAPPQGSCAAYWAY